MLVTCYMMTKRVRGDVTLSHQWETLNGLNYIFAVVNILGRLSITYVWETLWHSKPLCRNDMLQSSHEVIYCYNINCKLTHHLCFIQQTWYSYKWSIVKQIHKSVFIFKAKLHTIWYVVIEFFPARNKMLSCLGAHMSSNRRVPSAAGADGGGEAADSALLWVPEFLRLQHPGDGASAGRGQRHLFRLQRPRPGGQRRVRGWGRTGRKMKEGGRRRKERDLSSCMCVHLRV